MTPDTNIPEVVSINQMCGYLHISRSRLYQMIAPSCDGGIGLLYPPVYTFDRRPFFPRDIAEKNIALRRGNVGANGKIVIAYVTARRSSAVPKQAHKPKEKRIAHHPQNQEVLDGLEALGLTGVTPPQVDAVIRRHYPNGTEGVDAGDLLRAVFCAIRAERSQDNPAR